MRFTSLLYVVGATVTGCTLYDRSLIADAVGGEKETGDGDDSGDGDGDGDLSGDGDGDGDLSGDGDGDRGGTGGSASGTGGSGSNGGSGGSGSGVGGDGPDTPSDSLVDDFNDKDVFIEAVDGRVGSWQAQDDGTGGEMDPGPGDPFATAQVSVGDHALRVQATGFSGWGVGYFVSLNDPDGVGGAAPLPYDFEGLGYNSVRFRATKDAVGDASLLTLSLADVRSISGGVCEYVHQSASVLLTDVWQDYTLHVKNDFSTGCGARMLDQLYELHIVQPADEEPGVPIDFWIDDIEFVFVPE